MSKYWIKLYIEILDDPKMGRLTDNLYRRVIELFLLAGETHEGGYLPKVDDMAWRLRSGSELSGELEAIAETGIIAYDPDRDQYLVAKFTERQDASTDAERKQYQRSRDRKQNPIVTKRDTNGHDNGQKLVQEADRDRDTDTDTDRELDTYIQACEAATGYPITGTPDDLAALKEMAAIGATAEDISDAVAFFSSKGRVARGPAKLLASVKTAHAKRIQSQVQATPIKEPYAAEVYK